MSAGSPTLQKVGALAAKLVGMKRGRTTGRARASLAMAGYVARIVDQAAGHARRRPSRPDQPVGRAEELVVNPIARNPGERQTAHECA